VVNEENYTPLDPPKRGESFGNTDTKFVRVNPVTGKPKNQTKNLVQLNVKVRGKVKPRFEALYESAAAAKPGLTKGEFFELMLGAYEAQAAGVDIGKVVQAMHEAPVPTAKDKSAGRDRPLEIFVNPDLSKALNRRSSKNGWTVSETIEHACTMAKKAEGLTLELDKPCGHCGKQRKR
jgi:hypothetical protein